MSWGTIFCPPIGPSVRNALLVWIKSKGLYGVLLFNLLKVTPQIAGDCGFSEIIPLWGGDQNPYAIRPRGGNGRGAYAPINKTPPSEYTPRWGPCGPLN